jgi:hypothetical protein
MIRSELLWTLADYAQAGREAPPSVTSTPDMCEGDLMSNDEVEAFIKDSVATLRLLHDKESPRYDHVVGIFNIDMLALVELGRLEEDEYNELIAPSNLRFHSI